MLRIGVAFLAGHVLVHLLPALPSLWPWAAIVAILLATALWLRSVVAVAVLIGVFLAWFHAGQRLGEDLSQTLEGIDLVVVGDIASLPDATATDVQFELAVIEGHAGIPPRLRLAWYDGAQRPLPGERWRLVVRIKRRNGFANPGGFDHEAQLLRQGIGATGYVRNDDRNRRLQPARTAYVVLRARAWLAERIGAAVGNEPMLGILQGLAVGETQAMSVEQWTVLAATGTTHLMAISGLHITMIATLAAWLGGRVVRWPGAQHLRLTAIHGQVVCGGSAAMIYSILAGLSVPTQRTLAMLCIAFAARAVRREIGVGWIMGAALVAVLLVDPFAPLAVGTWLSFGAVGVILLATAGRRGREGTIGNFARVQIAVTLGLLPVVAAAFGSISLVSPLANALAVPLFTLIIVPLVLVGAFLAALWLPSGAVVLECAAYLLRFTWPGLEWFATWPLALWHLPQIPLSAHAAMLFGALLLVLPGILPVRLAATVLCLPALLWRPESLRQGEFDLTLLDVGQGLAAVVRTRSRVLVFDTGPAFRSGRDTGELVVLPYLRSQGIRTIDTLVISHGDLDHQGGMESIAQGLRVRRWLAGPSVAPRGRTVEICMRGQQWSWDGVRFEVLHPAAGISGSDNDSSCVLRIAGSGGSALLTGDIQREGEEAIVSAGLAQTDVVVAPHHGSRTSSTPALVEATDPSWVLFAAGYRNRWGFPKEDVVERWRENGARTLATPQSGAISLVVSAAGITEPGEFRRDHPRYWRMRSPGLP